MYNPPNQGHASRLTLLVSHVGGRVHRETDKYLCGALMSSGVERRASGRFKYVPSVTAAYYISAKTLNHITFCKYRIESIFALIKKY